MSWVFAVVGGVLAGGIDALLAWLFKSSWPAGIAVFVFCGVGWLCSLELMRRQMLCLAVWLSIACLIVFIVAPATAWAPVIFGATWTILGGLGFRAHEADNRIRDKILFRDHKNLWCPQCGEMLATEYGESSLDSAPNSSGYLTRTTVSTQYDVCKKCGFKRAR